MPLIQHDKIDNGEIGLWKISEEVEELLLLANLSLHDTVTYSAISALHRKKEWLATRALLNNLIGTAHLIKYHNDGRPYLENCHINISISHSTGYVAMILHGHAIPGIDIELISRQVGRVSSRFLSPDELEFCREKAELSNSLLLLHWCAKESIFKMIPSSNIEFSTDIRILINDFPGDYGIFQGTINKYGQIPITLYYKRLGEVLMVWGWVDEVLFK